MSGIPLFGAKYGQESVTDPAGHAEWVRGFDPEASLEDVAGVVMLYQRRLLDHALGVYRWRERPRWTRGGLFLLEHDAQTVAVCGGFGLGAPAAVLVMEQLISLGARRVVTVGTAAGMQSELGPGSLVLCEGALRDEGTSHHYLPPRRTAAAALNLTDRLGSLLPSAVRGMVWTTDAPYRQTRAEVAVYEKALVLAADMEAAALFTVAEYRQVEAAAVVAVADSLVKPGPRQHRPETEKALQRALSAAVQALTECFRGR
ncbi:nucleoside phosphorylase [Streptomyces sp. NPDC048272]|uniref:nucleoside phosphorylase n=1 Tax=Streptomyces sp. NPDC048272 TaxID=3154616 RepID=UPI00342FED44